MAKMMSRSHISRHSLASECSFSYSMKSEMGLMSAVLHESVVMRKEVGAGFTSPVGCLAMQAVTWLTLTSPKLFLHNPELYRKGFQSLFLGVNAERPG